MLGFQTENEIKMLDTDTTDFNFVDSRYTYVQLFAPCCLSHQSSCQWIDFE
jgi:hypothetical protein